MHVESLPWIGLFGHPTQRQTKFRVVREDFQRTDHENGEKCHEWYSRRERDVRVLAIDTKCHSGLLRQTNVIDGSRCSFVVSGGLGCISSRRISSCLDTMLFSVLCDQFCLKISTNESRCPTNRRSTENRISSLVIPALFPSNSTLIH